MCKLIVTSYLILLYLLAKMSFISSQNLPQILTTNSSDQQLTIRVGIMIAEKDTDYGLRRKNSAFGNSIAAITIALERLWRENILPRNVNFSFVWKFEKCVKSSAAGFSYELIKNFDIDVLIATPCMAAPPVSGQLATFYNIPVLFWGASLDSQLVNNNLYRTAISSVPNFKDQANTICDVMSFFKWQQFAFIMQNNLGGGCLPFSKDLDEAANTRSDCTIGYKDQFKKSNGNSSETFFMISQIKQRARIIVMCFDDIIQLRLFSLALFDAGMATSDYVYIIPDNDLTIATDKNKQPFWLENRGNLSFESRSENQVQPDGRDADAEAIGKLSFFLYLDMASSVASANTNFSEQLLSKVYDWPFYCNNCLKPGDLASIYAPLLYDSFYAYGLSLAKTLNQTGIASRAYRNGTLIAINSKNKFEAFQGMTGTVRLNSNGARRANYAFSNRLASTSGYKLNIWAYFNVTDSMANVTVTYSDDATTIWATRGGICPLAIPKCGFDGKGCPIPPFELYKAYIFSAIGLLCIIILSSAILIVYILRLRKEENRRQDKLWQISYSTLKKVRAKKYKRTERSSRSIMSGPGTINISGKFTIDSILRATQYSLYYHNQDMYVGRKHPSCGINTAFNLEDMTEYRNMCNLDHDNLNTFLGLCCDGPKIMSLWRYCERGSLKDVLSRNSMASKDPVFIYSIVRDLCEGLYYLHQSAIHCHGSLKSSYCLVDERWKVKISYFGLHSLKQLDLLGAKDLLWRAPELLRKADIDGNNIALINGTQQGDIYSLAMILTEVVNMCPCWEEIENNSELASPPQQQDRLPNLVRRSNRAFDNGDFEIEQNGRLDQFKSRNAEEIVYLIKKGGTYPQRPKIRPAIPDLSPSLLQLICECWEENQEDRPKITTIRSVIRSIQVAGTNLMDHVFSMLEEYALTLEKEVDERTRELVEEKKKSDLLLYRMLPQNIADRLKFGKLVEPESFECVTVFFSDVVQFTQIANRLRPLQVVNLLNELYTKLDSIIAEHDVYKVETIGDGYLCVSGLPKRNGNEHAREIADMSLKILESLSKFRIPSLTDEHIKLRIGHHSGPCVTGIVGLSMPRYCLFGDTVNTASRMESASLPNRIHISKETNHLLMEIGGYSTESRGEVIIKGKGVMQTFWLNGYLQNQHLKQHGGQQLNELRNCKNTTVNKGLYAAFKKGE